MNKLLTIFAALLVTAGLVAQDHNGGRAGTTATTIKIATKNGFAVKSTSDFGSGQTSAAAIADGTDVSKGRWIRARTSNGYAYASAYPRYSYSIGSGAALYDNGWAASNSGTYKGTACSANGTATKATCSAHSVLVNFAAKDGEDVTIVAYYSGYVNGSASGSGAVDIGNDGNVEMSVTNTTKYATTMKEFKVKAGKNGVDVLLTTTASAANKGKVWDRYSAYVRVYVKKPAPVIKCTITPFDEKNDPDKDPKKGCGGDLSATTGTTTTSRWLRVNLDNAPKNAVGFSVVGGSTLEVGLPGTKCKLLVDPTGLFLVPFTTSSTGTARHYVRVSTALKGTVYIQDVLLVFDAKGVQISSSNGLKIECKQE